MKRFYILYLAILGVMFLSGLVQSEETEISSQDLVRLIRELLPKMI